MADQKLFVPPWVRYEIVLFLHGRGLCFGTQGTPVYNPAAKTKDFYTIYGDLDRVLANPVVDTQESFFRLFAKHSMDHVVLGPKANKDKYFLKLAKDRLKPDGVLVVFDDQQLSIGGTISHEGWHLWCDHPEWKPMKRLNKTACVVRYGALGDLTMITPLLSRLDRDGFDITVLSQGYGAAVLENNPRYDRLLLQEKDAIHITELNKYFDWIRPKYDRFIDLCESIEGSMLRLESRREFYMPKEWREANSQENYYLKTLRLGGYDDYQKGDIVRGEFYLSESEKAWGKSEYNKLSDNGRYWVWGWALHGTSHHKCYPLMQPLLHQYLADHLDERVVLLGDGGHVEYQFDHPQVIKRAGVYSVRQLIAILREIDSVVSPESFIANAAAAWDKPTITLLSHSSRQNLTTTWKHDYSLEPSQVVAPCYPCHQLHYTLNSCPQREIIDTETNEIVIAGPACTIGAISMEALASRMSEVRSAFGSKNIQPIAPAG